MSDLPLRIGRYELSAELAMGGMATVHLGRQRGAQGFSKTVAIKRLHAPFARDPSFAAMFLDEGRLTSRIQHPNVVATLDVVQHGTELLLVMEYVHGESLSALLAVARKTNHPLPVPIAVAIVHGALLGLHAAHEARSTEGRPLGIVHRDVSPQNIVVGLDGVTRVLDFGIAKATEQSHQTATGVVKGKVRYMPPEQLRGGRVDRRTDVYSASVVLWEALTGRRLFAGDTDLDLAERILSGATTAPSMLRGEIPASLDEIVMRGCHPNPDYRYPTAEAMADALESLGDLPGPRKIGAVVAALADQTLARRAALVSSIEVGALTPLEPPAEPTHGSMSVRTPAQMPASDSGARLLAGFLAGVLGLVLAAWLGRGKLVVDEARPAPPSAAALAQPAASASATSVAAAASASTAVTAETALPIVNVPATNLGRPGKRRPSDAPAPMVTAEEPAAPASPKPGLYDDR